MTRTILAAVTAFLALTTVFSPAADAGCLSCEHVPVVVRGSLTSDTGSYYKKKRHYRRSIARAKAKARARAIAAAKAKAKARAIAAAKAKAKAKALAAAKAAAEQRLDDENSTISTASLDVSETIDTAETAPEEPKIRTNVGCKKFFPAVGMTLTVPCE